MKHVCACLIATAFVLVFGSAGAQSSSIVQTSNTNENQPYKIALPNLSFGNNQFSKYVLNAWKAYDFNRLDELAFILSDTVNAGLADGKFIRGKEAFMTTLKEYRSGFASAVSKVHACTTLQSPNDPMHSFTLIWGEETDTKKDGTVQKLAIHEVWVFDKAGKVAEFYQYAVPLPAN